MNIDELLREAAPDPHLLRDHADRLRDDVLGRASSRTPGRTRRPLRVAAAAVAVSALGIGGVAAATGDVPRLFSGIVDDFGADNHVPASHRPELHQIVDLTLPDGSRFAAWRGESDAMWCDAYTDGWDGMQPTGWGGAACGDPASARLNDDSLAWARAKDRTTFYPVLFGVARAGEVEVEVSGTFAGTGERTRLTVPVDPANSAYAVTLPGSNDDPWSYLRDGGGLRESGLTLRFIGASGQVLRTTQAPAG